MQIKIIIIGILVACSYLIGEYIYKAYTNRHKQINDLIRILEIIRMDLSFGMYTLEEIFSRMGQKAEYCTANFFNKIKYEFEQNQGRLLDEILSESINVLSSETYLQDKEIEELKKLILTLGRSDMDSQLRMIDLSIENLKKITHETKEDIDKKGIVYKKLTTVIGLIIGIILM